MHQDMFHIITDMYRYDEHLEFFHITSNSVKNSLVVKLELQKCASMYIELPHFLHDLFKYQYIPIDGFTNIGLKFFFKLCEGA